MKRLLQILAIVAMMPLGASNLSEGLNRKFNGENWTVASEHQDADGLAVQYIPSDETPDQWNEKVIVQVFPGQKYSMIDYANQFNAMMETNPDGKYAYHILNDQPNERIYEWWLTNPEGKQTHVGWIRITVDEKALKAIHAEVKNPKSPTAERTRWVETLKAYNFLPKSE